jgi:NAD(P)-dependent dehydrogenase (short-subunit alcohol dehydrogenase family)
MNFAPDDAARSIVVTGGSSGVGRAVVERLGRPGDRIASLDLNPAEQTARHCRAGFRDIRTDLASAESVQAGFMSCDEFFAGGPPDLLVCSAAISLAGGFLDAQVEDLDALFAINVRGLFVTCQEAARRMRKVGRGRIVVITSVAAFQGWQREPLYCASKGAQEALVRAMAVELAPFGIAVNAVAPGPLEAQSPSMVSTRNDPEVLRHDLERIPLGRFGHPAEIAQAVEFAAFAPWMTGQTIVVDGGFMASGLSYFGAARARLTAARPTTQDRAIE